MARLSPLTTPPPATNGPGPNAIHIDNSLLTKLGCDTAALMSGLHRYTTSDAQLPARLGQAVHEALARHFAGSPPADTLAHFTSIWQPISDAHALDDTSDIRSLSNVLKILTYWLATHPPSAFRQWTIKAIEVPFSFPLCTHGNLTVYFDGRIDLIARSRLDNRVIIVDHKLATLWPSKDSWVKSWRMKSQFRGYAWACREITGHVPRVVLNVIHLKEVPGKAQVWNKDKTRKVSKPCTRPEHKGRALEDCGVEHRTDFLHEITFSPADLDEWRAEFERAAKAYLRLREARPRLEDALEARRQGISRGMCGAYSCDFTAWCEASRRRDLIESLLEPTTWSPLDWSSAKPVRRLKV